jgi:hypothetical protein
VIAAMIVMFDEGRSGVQDRPEGSSSPAGCWFLSV